MLVGLFPPFTETRKAGGNVGRNIRPTPPGGRRPDPGLVVEQFAGYHFFLGGKWGLSWEDPEQLRFAPDPPLLLLHWLVIPGVTVAVRFVLGRVAR